MLKYFILLVLFLNTFKLSAQEDYDTTYAEDFSIDTNKVRHMGIGIGTFINGLFYTDINRNCICDSINILSSTPQKGISVGIIIERDLGEKLWLHSGLHVNVSKMNINYSINDVINNYSFNYSSLEVPLWLQYSFKNKRRGLSWGGGISPSIDITRVVDKEIRSFKLKNADLLIGTGPNFRWMLPSGAYINLGLRINYGIINLINNSSISVYNKEIESANRWQTTLLVSIN